MRKSNILILYFLFLCPNIILGNITNLQNSFFEQNCLECHDNETQKGDLDLTSLSFNMIDTQSLKTWVKIYDAISNGDMPPKKKERPEPSEKAALLNWLDTKLHSVNMNDLESNGRMRMRRMTRSEFENTLKDLLKLESLDIQEMLPVDNQVAGFEKISDGLDLSFAHLKGYTKAVEHALNKAIVTRSKAPPVSKHRIYPAGQFKFEGPLMNGNYVLLNNYEIDPKFPVRGGYEDVKWYINAHDQDKDLVDRRKVFEKNKLYESKNSVGLLTPALQGREPELGFRAIFPGKYKLNTAMWGFYWNQGKVEPILKPGAASIRAHAAGEEQEGGRLLDIYTADSLKSKTYETIAWLDTHESIIFHPLTTPWKGLMISQIGGRTKKHIGPGIAIDYFEFEGPLYESWPPESHRILFGDLAIKPVPKESKMVPPFRKKIGAYGFYLPNFHLLPREEKNPILETVQTSQPLEDAYQLLNNFLPKAFRRPIKTDEIKPYLALVKHRLSQNDCFEDAMKRTYIAILTSPEFLFHKSSRKDNPYKLASRLSYWLWNSPPDELLLAKAKSGALLKKAVLLTEVDRLLNDKKSHRFIKDFSDQWLQLHRINETMPDKKLYPEYSILLHKGMEQEVHAFVKEMISRNLPIKNLVNSDFAMLNQSLSELYKIDNVNGVDTRYVKLPRESVRGGLLTQAAILKLTANGTTTSPVTRGVWVMDRLLNNPPPLPPDNVSDVDPDTRGTTTIREQLEKHRSNSNCSICHAKIDGPGFAMESFDPLGGFRTHYRTLGKGNIPPEKKTSLLNIQYKLSHPVDDSGQLANGAKFSNIKQFKSLLATQEDRLAKAFIAHLSRYATGTDISYSDRRIINDIVKKSESQHFRMRDLFHHFATSDLFFEF